MNCEICGTEIEAKGKGRPRRTCSDRCRAALSRRKKAATLRIKKPDVRDAIERLLGEAFLSNLDDLFDEDEVKPAPLEIKVELAHEARKKWAKGSDGSWILYEMPSRWATVPTEDVETTDPAIRGITVEMVEAAGFVEDERASFGTWPLSDREERPNFRIVGDRRIEVPKQFLGRHRLGSNVRAPSPWPKATETMRVLKISAYRFSPDHAALLAHRDREDMTVSANLYPLNVLALEVGWRAEKTAVGTPREKRIRAIMQRTGWPRRKVMERMDKASEAEAFPVTDDPVIREVAWEIGLDGWAAMLAVRSEDVTPVEVAA